MYQVDIRHPDGTRRVSRFFQTVKAAKTWARWLADSQGQPTLVMNQQGGLFVTAYTPRVKRDSV